MEINVKVTEGGRSGCLWFVFPEESQLDVDRCLVKMCKEGSVRHKNMLKSVLLCEEGMSRDYVTVYVDERAYSLYRRDGMYRLGTGGMSQPAEHQYAIINFFKQEAKK